MFFMAGVDLAGMGAFMEVGGSDDDRPMTTNRWIESDG